MHGITPKKTDLHVFLAAESENHHSFFLSFPSFPEKPIFSGKNGVNPKISRSLCKEKTQACERSLYMYFELLNPKMAAIFFYDHSFFEERQFSSENWTYIWSFSGHFTKHKANQVIDV